MRFTDDELRYLLQAIGMEPFGCDLLDPDELADRIEAELARRRPHEPPTTTANPNEGENHAD